MLPRPRILPTLLTPTMRRRRHHLLSRPTVSCTCATTSCVVDVLLRRLGLRQRSDLLHSGFISSVCYARYALALASWLARVPCTISRRRNDRMRIIFGVLLIQLDSISICPARPDSVRCVDHGFAPQHPAYYHADLQTSGCPVNVCSLWQCTARERNATANRSDAP